MTEFVELAKQIGFPVAVLLVLAWRVLPWMKGRLEDQDKFVKEQLEQSQNRNDTILTGVVGSLTAIQNTCVQIQASIAGSVKAIEALTTEIRSGRGNR